MSAEQPHHPDLEDLSGAEALKALESRREGLSAEEAQERLVRFGRSALVEHRRSLLQTLLG